ncbi:sulfatase [Roseiconus nitratireducens]|uniref:Sulfatase n=1 Tax=Roseiconus nitratireducens TaxID=2605748 RepID=A0A5M6D344_9BACT|nr:sulfatase [Roseiconus nitratireducens]KAA5541010.1 sulfatase [Roseiconus nitratireducens]
MMLLIRWPLTLFAGPSLAALWLVCLCHTVAVAGDRPNIVWISCEDISPNLGCYGDPHAITPNLDRLASQGVRFDNAFTPAGVCAVVRSSVITGMYAPAIGSQHMRSHIIPPPEVRAFPEYLRAAGYFCTNRSKTDYQFDPVPSIWDRQGNDHNDWRDRREPDQPFFSVINFTISHESQIRHSQQKHDAVIESIGQANARDPDQVADTLPAYLPDTPAARKNWAWYHDNITRMDQMAGEVLERLEQDGLADNTLVVFWSDHGMGMPRGKRWIYDSGTHIPMIMRWPDHLKSGSVRRDLTSTVDLAATMLAVAGVSVPKYLQGRVLIGEKKQPEPSYLYFHRDRMDEVYELQRGCRDRRWKYIRNYMPERTYAQRIDYMDEMPAMKDWRRLAAEGGLVGGQANWFAETKPAEELYDTENDPWELKNLAARPQYRDRLARMRQALESWQDEIGDTGMIPEPVLMGEMKPGGEIPQTKPPTQTTVGGNVFLESMTEGSAVVYRTRGEDGKWGDWMLFSETLELPGGLQLEAKACRIGYRTSPVVTLTVDEDR